MLKDQQAGRLCRHIGLPQLNNGAAIMLYAALFLIVLSVLQATYYNKLIRYKLIGLDGLMIDSSALPK
jgi:hypothetical protein